MDEEYTCLGAVIYDKAWGKKVFSNGILGNRTDFYDRYGSPEIYFFHDSGDQKAKNFPLEQKNDAKKEMEKMLAYCSGHDYADLFDCFKESQAYNASDFMTKYYD